MKTTKIARLTFFAGLILSVLFSAYIYVSYKRDLANAKDTVMASLSVGVEKVTDFIKNHEELTKEIQASYDSVKQKSLVEYLKTELKKSEYATHAKVLVFKNKELIANSSAYVFEDLDNINEVSSELIDSSFSSYKIDSSLYRGKWEDPYKCSLSDNYLVNYTIAFKSGIDNSTNIVINLGIGLDTFYEFVKQLDYDSLGYASIYTNTGQLLYHPKIKYVYSNNTIYDLADSKIKEQSKLKKSVQDQSIIKNANILKDVCQKATNGESGCADYKSVVTYQDMILCYKPIFNGWSSLSLCLKLNATKFIVDYKVKYFLLITMFLLTLMAGVRFYYRDRLWIASFIASFFIVLGIFSLWYVNHQLPENHKKPINYLGNYGEVQQFKKKVHKKAGNVVDIPTGIFVQSVEFNNANNFKVTGYIWQRYKLADTTTVRGFQLPEAEDMSKEIAYREISGDEEIIGWYFIATIRERFDYADYPLDRERLWIRFWDADFSNYVNLVPDVEAYDVMNPVFKPGIEKDFVLSGWKIAGSYFSYAENTYNTNFGIHHHVTSSEYPELYFNIDITRDFIDPFISHMIPLVIVMIMLFAILMVARKNDEKGLLGFSSLSAVSAASALFFVIIFNHINLRNTLNVSGLVYFEWFYIIAYFAILYVSINSLLIGQQVKIKYLYSGDNYLSRLLFVPVVFAVSYIITFVIFVQ